MVKSHELPQKHGGLSEEQYHAFARSLEDKQKYPWITKIHTKLDSADPRDEIWLDFGEQVPFRPVELRYTASGLEGDRDAVIVYQSFGYIPKGNVDIREGEQIFNVWWRKQDGIILEHFTPILYPGKDQNSIPSFFFGINSFIYFSKGGSTTRIVEAVKVIRDFGPQLYREARDIFSV